MGSANRSQVRRFSLDGVAARSGSGRPPRRWSDPGGGPGRAAGSPFSYSECGRRLTATEAARRFSALLDQVERDGETFLVERRGRAVASIAPAAAVSGRVVKDLLRVQPADAGWTRELAELRAGLEPGVRSWNG